MDITILFKACVKTVRTTNKALGVKETKQPSVLTTNKDVNLAKAKDIVKQITKLQTFLLENKAAYLNVLNYLSTNKTMSEVDREHIDAAAEKIVSSCTTLINQYNEEVAQFAKTEQKEEHYGSIVQSLERYLKSVSKIYAEAKAIRVKRVIETHKLSKLETVSPPAGGDLPKDSTELTGNSKSKSKSNLEVDRQVYNEIHFQPLPPPEDIDTKLSPAEIQMFESENELLFNELNSLSDEVKQMESKVVHIAQLQEVFTEKVLQQEKDIERIATTVSTATDNVKDANEQLKQAMQRNAGLRVYILFFILVMSLSLLFLDWYND